MTIYSFHETRLWVCSRSDGALQPAVCDACRIVESFASCDGRQRVGAAELPLLPPPLPAGESLLSLRDLYDRVSPTEFADAQRAFQLLYWRRTHRFCGACGGALARKSPECAMTCPTCGLDFFPRLNPVVIVRITRGDRILLARRARGTLPFYSVIAGFVEAGETLEQAVAREIQEEVGLTVNNIRYFASQPWPFPNNLMIGFTAEYAGGEIHVDGEEIGEADWFSRDALPPIPSRISISRWMIDDFLAAGT